MQLSISTYILRLYNSHPHLDHGTLYRKYLSKEEYARKQNRCTQAVENSSPNEFNLSRAENKSSREGDDAEHV